MLQQSSTNCACFSYSATKRWYSRSYTRKTWSAQRSMRWKNASDAASAATWRRCAQPPWTRRRRAGTEVTDERCGGVDDARHGEVLQRTIEAAKGSRQVFRDDARMIDGDPVIGTDGATFQSRVRTRAVPEVLRQRRYVSSATTYDNVFRFRCAFLCRAPAPAPCTCAVSSAGHGLRGRRSVSCFQ